MIEIINANGVLMIGETPDDAQASGSTTVRRPRAIAIQSQNGQTLIQLPALVGNPTEITIRDKFLIWRYKCGDQQLENAYRQEVSGLQIVNKMPQGVRQN
jgi:hypothetical protein